MGWLRNDCGWRRSDDCKSMHTVRLEKISDEGGKEIGRQKMMMMKLCLCTETVRTTNYGDAGKTWARKTY